MEVVRGLSELFAAAPVPVPLLPAPGVAVAFIPLVGFSDPPEPLVFTSFSHLMAVDCSVRRIAEFRGSQSVKISIPLLGGRNCSSHFHPRHDAGEILLRSFSF